MVDVIKIAGSFLIGAASALATARGYLDTTVDQAVNKRLAPYQKVASAVSLNQFEDWDNAAQLFREVLREAEKTELPAETMDLMYDGLLLAISNAASTADFSVEIYKIKDKIGKSIPDDAWRNHQMGWCLLRMGRAPEATDYFLRSRQLYDSKQDRRRGADPTRGLLLVALSQDKVEE